MRLAWLHPLLLTSHPLLTDIYSVHVSHSSGTPISLPSIPLCLPCTIQVLWRRPLNNTGPPCFSVETCIWKPLETSKVVLWPSKMLTGISLITDGGFVSWALKPLCSLDDKNLRVGRDLVSNDGLEVELGKETSSCWAGCWNASYPLKKTTKKQLPTHLTLQRDYFNKCHTFSHSKFIQQTPNWLLFSSLSSNYANQKDFWFISQIHMPVFVGIMATQMFPWVWYLTNMSEVFVQSFLEYKKGDKWL